MQLVARTTMNDSKSTDSTEKLLAINYYKYYLITKRNQEISRVSCLVLLQVCSTSNNTVGKKRASDVSQ